MAIENSNLVHKVIKYGLRVAYQYSKSEIISIYFVMQLYGLSSTYPLYDFIMIFTVLAFVCRSSREISYKDD